MDIVREKLPNLLEKTSNLPKLTGNLYAKKVISQFEFDTIVSKPTLFEKNVELYRIVMTKGDDEFQNLLHCLRTSENEQAANELEGKLRRLNSIWHEIGKTISIYSGRETELDHLKKWWHSNQSENNLIIALISGLGGVGKSELARVFIKHLYDSCEVNCIWLNSETEVALLESVKTLANKVGIETKDKSEEEKEVSLIISSLLDYFSMKKVVMVFDSTDEITTTFNLVMQEIQKLELSGPSVSKPFVIITTRFPAIQNELSGNFKLIELDALSLNEAVVFLTKSLKIRNRDQNKSLEELANRLQCFPLDLQQAVGYINSQHSKSIKLRGSSFGVKDYLKLFDKQNKPSLDSPADDTAGLNNRSQITYANWKVGKQKLSNLSTVGYISIQVMNIISFLSPDGIKVSLLVDITRQYFEEIEMPIRRLPKFMRSMLRCQSTGGKRVSEKLIEDAIVLCTSYSLLSLKNSVVRVHRLLQEVIRVDLSKMFSLDKPVLAVLVDCFEYLLGNKSIPDNCMHHLIQVWDHLSSDKELVEEYKHFPQCIFDQLEKEVKYLEAVSFALKAMQVLKSINGEDNEVTLLLMHERCRVLVKNGKYVEAMVGLRQTYDKRKLLNGEQHVDTLRTECSIGEALYFQERYTEAMDVLLKVASTQEKVVGKTHKDTLRTKSMIGSVLRRQDKLDEALSIFTELDQITEFTFGKDHQNTLAGKNNMALVLSDQGNYKKALEIYYNIQTIQQRDLGSTHPDTLITVFNIAHARHNMGEHSVSLSLFQDVYKKQKSVLGADHPLTMKTKACIDDESDSTSDNTSLYL